MKGAIIIEGHVQGLSNVRSMGRLGVPVFVINRERFCIARFSKYCKRFFTCPPYDSNELADFLEDLAKKENLSGWIIFPSNDHAVLTLSRNRKRLNKYFTFLLPEHETVCRIYDKMELMKTASEASVPIPATWQTEDADPGQIRYPCIIKGRHGLRFFKATGTKAIICNTSEELRKNLSLKTINEDPGIAMIQEVIPFDGTNHTVSVAVFCEDGEIRTLWMGRKLREHPLRFGTATLTESTYDPRLREITGLLMRTLKYRGIAEAEFIFDPIDKDFKLIEINTRTWLWTGHAAECGIDFAAIAWRYCTGEKINWPEEYRTGLKWRNFYTDTYYGIKAVFSGMVSLSAWINQLKGQKMPAVWSSDDPLPFIMLTAFLPLLKIQR